MCHDHLNKFKNKETFISTMNCAGSNSLKYKRSPSDCQVIGIRKLEFLAIVQFSSYLLLTFCLLIS